LVEAMEPILSSIKQKTSKEKCMKIPDKL